MLLRNLAHAFDPVTFANDCGIVPDAWQAELLRSTARRALLLCSRQSGKSTATALLALWVAVFEAPRLNRLLVSRDIARDHDRALHALQSNVHDRNRTL